MCILTEADKPLSSLYFGKLLTSELGFSINFVLTTEQRGKTLRHSI